MSWLPNERPLSGGSTVYAMIADKSLLENDIANIIGETIVLRSFCLLAAAAKGIDKEFTHTYTRRPPHFKHRVGHEDRTE